MYTRNIFFQTFEYPLVDSLLLSNFIMISNKKIIRNIISYIKMQRQSFSAWNDPICWYQSRMCCIQYNRPYFYSRFCFFSFNFCVILSYDPNSILTSSFIIFHSLSWLITRTSAILRSSFEQRFDVQIVLNDLFEKHQSQDFHESTWDVVKWIMISSRSSQVLLGFQTLQSIFHFKPVFYIIY